MTEQKEDFQTQQGYLRELVQDVLIHRTEFALIDSAIKSRREQWEKDNWEILARQKQLLEIKDKAESILRERAVDFYNETKNKLPAPGVEVKLYQVLNYEEPKALEWAKQSGIALKLDTKAFEKVVKAMDFASGRPDFVEIKEEARCTIATDLAKVLNNKPETK
jgi:hypothetical protein